jgi:uncharacterized membrane protein YuzA (DUF378 family)
MSTTKGILDRIDHKIHYHREDTLLNHIKSCFKLDTKNYNGICKDNKFIIWRLQDNGLWFYQSIFYFVITGEVSMANGKPTVVLNAKLNILARLFSLLIFGLFVFALSQFRFGNLPFITILIFLVFGLLAIWLIVSVYFFQRKNELKDVEKIIEKETTTN